MDDLTPPALLAAALRAEGFRLAGPIGTGGGGPRWSVTDEDGRRWAVTQVPPGAAASRARRRAAALNAVPHEGIAALGQVVELEDGSVVVLQDAPAGLDLDVLMAARGSLAPGEVVGLLAPVARALAALHAAGLAHGDVSPGNLVVRAGRAVLVDLVEGDAPGLRGTPGFAPPGRASRGADAAGDVHGLARVGLHLLVPAGSADGQTEEAALVRACLRAACSPGDGPEPVAPPPSAAELADALEAAAVPQPLVLPDPAVLARLALRRLAGPAVSSRSIGGARRAVTVRSRRSAGRHRRRARTRTTLRVALALGAAVGLGASVDAAGACLPGGCVGGPDRPDAVATAVVAAARLTASRAVALGSDDASALAAITVPGSPAAAADAALLHRLQATGVLPLHVGTAVRAWPVEAGSAGPAGRRGLAVGWPDPGGAGPWAAVRVVATTWTAAPGATPSSSAPGASVGTAADVGQGTDARGPRGGVSVSAVTLVLRAAGGWRVAEVRPAVP